MARIWGQHWNMPAKHLLSWAAAHCALSICWAGSFDQVQDTDLLAMLLKLREAEN